MGRHQIDIYQSDGNRQKRGRIRKYGGQLCPFYSCTPYSLSFLLIFFLELNRNAIFQIGNKKVTINSIVEYSNFEKDAANYADVRCVCCAIVSGITQLLIVGDTKS